MAAMEFSYRIAEAEYVQAGMLYLKASGKSGRIRKLLFWLLVFGCTVALWGFVTANPYVVTISRGPDGAAHATTIPNDPSQTIARITRTLVVNFGPIAAFGVILVGVIAFRGPEHRLRNAYQRDPSMQGELTVNVTPEYFSEQNSAGAFSQNRWTIYESWREEGSLIVVILRSQAYEILNLAGLGEAQRTELRSVLTSVLPQK
jgi:hypothetical protein